ncbi:MAG: hypothetical protein ACYTAN_13320 [Planctomycetota bacterium]|jgi:hypothetical protein
MWGLDLWNVGYVFGSACFVIVVSVHGLVHLRLAKRKGTLRPDVQRRTWWLVPLCIVLLAKGFFTAFLSVLLPLADGWFFIRPYMPGLFLALSTELGFQGLSAQRAMKAVREAATSEAHEGSWQIHRAERRSFLTGLGAGLLTGIAFAVLCLWAVCSFTRPAIYALR